MAVAHAFWADADVVAIPGACAEGYVRFALTVDRVRTRDAATRIAQLQW